MDEHNQYEDALTLDPAYTEGALTAILFAAGDPVETKRLAEVVGIDEEAVNDALQRAADRLAYERRGLRLMRLDDRWQFVTAPEYASAVRKALDQRKAPRLSQTALEVLTIIAYRQPVTRGYIETVRGVDSGYTVNMLEDKGLIEVAGRLDAPGRPMLYQTTPAFLRVFGITSLDELPPLPEDTPLPPVTPETGVVEA